MRIDIWSNAREKANVLENGLKVLMETKTVRNGMGYFLQVWKPRGKNPYVNAWFKTEEQRIGYLKQTIESHNAHKRMIEERKKARQPKPQDLEKVKPGTIFVWSWGYEQTNLNFYQVIERHGRKVTLRGVAQETVPGSNYEHGMVDMRVAKPDHFLEKEEPFTKIIQFLKGELYISMEFGWCGPWNGKPKYCSWYH